eukprot:466198-Prorocentrum_minimum.AAC.40
MLTKNHPKIFDKQTKRYISVKSKLFPKRLQEQFQTGLQHFNIQALKDLGYNSPGNARTKPVNARTKPVNAPTKPTTKDLGRLIRKQVNHVRHEYRYINDKHKLSCHKADTRYGADELLNSPFVRKTLEYDVSYLKSPIQGSFDVNMLQYRPKSWKVAEGLLKIKQTSTNYDRMNPMTDDTAFLNMLDLKWFKSTNAYLMSLNTEELFALKGYTGWGDSYVNSYVRSAFNHKQWLKDFTENKHYFDKNKSQNEKYYFPLFFPLLSLFHNRSAFLEETDAGIQYFVNKYSRGASWHDIWTKTTNKSHDYWLLVENVVPLLKGDVIMRAIQILSKTINDVINRAPATTRKMVLYRGTDSNNYFKRDTGNVFHKIKGFISTSLSQDAVDDFMGGYRGGSSVKCCLTKITVLPGSKLLFLGGLSHIPEEMEFVLGLGTTYLMRGFNEITYNPDFRLCNHANERRRKLLVTSVVAL